MAFDRIQLVLFDFDGTLTRPGALDFPRIKQALGCPLEQPILEFIQTIEDEQRREWAETELARFELEAARRSAPSEGAAELLRFLKSRDLFTGILTRNTRESVVCALDRFPETGLDDFDIVITRETPVAHKPSPEGVLMAAERLGLFPGQVMVVGDYLFDIHAGVAAGAVTVFLDTGAHGIPAPECDHVIASLSELRAVVRRYLPLPAGKFPNDLLKGALAEMDFRDPSVIVHPGIGEDIAAVDVSAEEVLILKSDPITFATDAIGHYAVLVNANDMVTSGADPRWLLTTLLFPEGSTPARIYGVIRDLERISRRWGITLCGGHTEITDAVARPVVSGTLAGTVRRDRLIDKKAMRPGDCVLITKGLAVEGTSIVARELSDRLLEAGMTAAMIERCKAFLDQIGVLTEARIAAESGGVSAMHDVTEGGLATALTELSAAGRHRIRVHMENIPVLPETEEICRLMRLHPLGLIGSGSLLVCCRKECCKDLIRDIFQAGVQVTYIGEVSAPGEGVDALFRGEASEWPRFEVDEIARLFSNLESDA